MLPTPCNHAIWPSVVRCGVPSEMTVIPAERAFLLREDEEYQLNIIAVNGDEDDYYHCSAWKTLTASAHDGVLSFVYTFDEEMEYLIQLKKNDTLLQEMRIYALEEDQYALMPLKGDFHSHSFRSDGKRDPAALAGHYREQGYDFFALTDHNRFFPGGEIDEAYEGVHTGFTRVRGEEVHTPPSIVHIVHVGGRSSVADLYVHGREKYEQEKAEYLTRVPAHIPAKYHERYAMAMWATDRIHEAGGLAIFPHPYWQPTGSRMHNVCDELARIFLTSGMFDAYELIGGMGQAGNNRSVALWADARAEGLRISVVGSSDVHGIRGAYSFPHYFTICFAASNNNDAIIEAVRKGLSVAVEAAGDEYNRCYRCYGNLRLVSYAQYLLNHYFPQQQRLCQGEGAAMRAYAMGETDASAIEGLARLTSSFRERFFGKAAPILPSPKVLTFEEKWRQVQLSGPQTKGGMVDTPPVNLQI